MNERFRFWWWRVRLDFWGFRYGCRFRYSKATGKESWRYRFEHGETPRDALQEDWNYA